MTCPRVEVLDGFSGAGQLLPGVIARVVKPDGTLAGYDEAGELVVYSPSNALRYENNAEAWVTRIISMMCRVESNAY